MQALVGEGPIKTRLGSAYSEFLEDLQQVELPIAGKQLFNELHAALHSVGPMGNNGCVQASIRKMSPSQAAWHAQTIVRIYGELVALEKGAKAPLEPLLTAADRVEDSPPRFLVGRN
ncbi:MAG: hypothetical protein R3305_10740 [Gammaproteobacteria bacterium]|nr:hypothetical protein [Gammaproteobacteria bacterium]